jgi:hypothetical protein
MSYDAERIILGRQPVMICEIDLDKCAEVWSVSACTASGAAGSECFNTRSTCQDPANFNNTATLTLKLSTAFIPGEDYIHCIDKATLAPTVINPAKGLGQRASIKVSFNDFAHHDRGIDPYIANRTYTAEDQGTYLAKMLARNVHLAGRAMRIKTGYIGDPFNIADFQTRNYIIENVTGPDNKGRVTIEAKDILKLADDERAEAPAASTGELVAGISAAATSLTVTSGTEGEYNAESDYLRIGDEIILSPAGSRTANVFASLTRGAFNTAAETHDLGDSVQACKHLDAVNPVDLVKDLLENYASIPTAYIVGADWNAERDTWYSGVFINTLITEPQGVTSLINELAEQFFFQSWWNEIDQEIIFKSITPPLPGATIPTYTDGANLLLNETTIKRDEKRRLTRVLFYYNPVNPIEFEKAKDFKGFHVQIDADAEGTDEYGDTRQKVIYGRFVGSAGAAVQTAGRLLGRFRDVPRDLQFKLDAKDADLWTGEYVDIESNRVQDINGAPEKTRFQILSAEEKTSAAPGTVFLYKALELNFAKRYWFIGPNSLTTYDLETDENRAKYGFISPDSGKFASDDGDAYRII